MGLEVMSMDAWHHLITDEGQLDAARHDYLAGILSYLAWITCIDAFQMEIYRQPELSPDARRDVWLRIHGTYSSTGIDWSGLEDMRATLWHKQLHLFRYPLYYIEYGIAQLGALQLLRNYRMDKKETIARYKAAQALAYTKSVPDIYKAAGIRFDFSSDMVRDLMDFVEGELAALQ